MSFSPSDFKDAVSPSLKIMKILGTWLPKPKTPQWKLSCYYTICTICISMFFMLYVLSEISNLILSRDDLKKVTEASFLFMTHLSETIKCSQCIIYHKRIHRLISSFKNTLFQPRNEYQCNKIKQTIKQARSVFYLFLCMSWGTILLWAIFPLIEKQEGEPMRLPIKANYPFETDFSPVFEIVYVYQIVSIGFMATINVGVDMCISGVMQIVGCELDILNDTLVNIRGIAEEKLQERNEKNGRQRCEDVSEELQEVMDEIFVECVQKHRIIIRTTNEIGEIFNVTVLSQFVASVLIVCITMFQLTLVKPFSVQFISMVLYQGCMLLQIFLLCWFGNEIILKSSTICLSIYSSNWYLTSQKYKNNMIFLMTRAQKPICLYAGNLFILSLTTFAAILRTSWSYFAVLRSMQNEEL